MGEVKETKRIAARVDARYIERPSPLARWRRWLTMLSFIGFGAWAAWVAWSQFRRNADERMFNPGPVALVHARFEHDCRACHASGSGGTFERRVTDAACLKCHDAGRHHPMARLNPGDPSKPQLTSAAGAMNCVACHVEHRGREALAATADDRLCVQCHGDLAKHIDATGLPLADFPASIQSFPAQHPAFGRRLAAAGISMPDRKATTQPAAGSPQDAWLPTLALKFNHATHCGPESFAKIESCTACHVTSPSSPGAIDAPALVPEMQTPPQAELKRPWRTGFAATSTASRPGADMWPVRYETSCRSCHPIGLPITPDLQQATMTIASTQPTRKVAVPMLAHDRMELVRAQLSDVDRLYLDLLTSLPNGRASLLRDPKSGQERPPEQWLVQQKMELAELLRTGGSKKWLPRELVKAEDELDEARKALADELKKAKPDPKDLKDLRDDLEAQTQKVRDLVKAMPPAALATACEAKLATATCGKCHFTEGDVVDAAQYKASLAAPGGGGATALTTLPTHVPAVPRRWLQGARFDHDKHRDMACLDCHAGMDKDEDGRVRDDKKEIVERYLVRLPAMQTCATCHAPDTSAARGAGTSCASCHAFHGRRTERDFGK
jgi:predicted CXXCH cytochrome family protein